MNYGAARIGAWTGNRLSDKRAVVTGAGRGIGKGVALMLAAQGAHVVACDINVSALETLKAEARAAGLEHLDTIAADLTQETGAAAVAAAARQHLGDVQILV